MTPLFSKLQLGEHRTLHVLGAPASFEAELTALAGVTVLRRIAGPVRFALAFVVRQVDLDAISAALADAATGDAVLWMVYPKRSSRRYQCEFSRDAGWSVIGAAGYEPVRQVAVDADWSALRFRKAEHIRAITRHPDGEISRLGRQRAVVRQR